MNRSIDNHLDNTLDNPLDNTLDNQVVLVDEHDHTLGTMDKLQAHKEGVLHRAFSVFVIRNHSSHTKNNPEILLQQRAKDKYHSGGLWTNTCCSHPRLDEDIVEAAQRRLQEEMGFSVPLKWMGSFIYKAVLPNALIEHELDHVLVGDFTEANLTPDAHIPFNPNEVADTRWISITDLKQDLAAHPERYTPWLSLALRFLP